MYSLRRARVVPTGSKNNKNNNTNNNNTNNNNKKYKNKQYTNSEYRIVQVINTGEVGKRGRLIKFIVPANFGTFHYIEPRGGQMFSLSNNEKNKIGNAIKN